MLKSGWFFVVEEKGKKQSKKKGREGQRRQKREKETVAMEKQLLSQPKNISPPPYFTRLSVPLPESGRQE